MTDTLKIIGWPSVEPMIPLDDWLCERAANCERHAENKTGMDRELWLQDAAYFKGAAALALTYKRFAEQVETAEALAAKVVEWDDARRRFVDHGFMGDAHEADRLGVEIVADARELTSVFSAGESVK
jgi:hypothetical protein